MSTAKTTLLLFFVTIFFCGIVFHSNAYEFHWEIDETPEGQESATVVEPIQVTILDEQIEISGHSASLWLMHRYSVHLGAEWSAEHAYKLLQTFISIPQDKNNFNDKEHRLPISLWKLSDRHIQDDIEIEYHGDTKVVTVAREAFIYAKPLLAEIEGVRGRYFSKRLHQAAVRFVTDNGADRHAIKRILRDRFDVSIDVPDYTKLTQYTTAENAVRFTAFKNEELIALVSMLEEFPQGMLKTPGLKYLVRRLDGTPHPLYPTAAAVAWTGAGYIEFMEVAFKDQGLDSIHRLILHEKAHFLWAYLFDEQLKQDWIELGGWYENPDDQDGWSTTKQTEFVSAYAHGVNPNEDMAESISFYIVRPDKLRSRSPAKYEFIQNRVMHGTRYISQIREDLTFEVYNLYPDYIYPGRIIGVDIRIDGEPKEEKHITIEIKIHSESHLDTAHEGFMRLFSEKGTYEDIRLYPIDATGQPVQKGHIFRGHLTLSRYAANGYWAPDTIRLWDITGNERHQSQTDFGWKLYVDNPLADCDPPRYVPNSMRLSLSEGFKDGRSYQIVTARWKLIEENGISGVYARINDSNPETYSLSENWGEYNPETGEASVGLIIPDYYQSGIYTVDYISMVDVALNLGNVYFNPTYSSEFIGEESASIEIQTKNPDSTPPTLDLDRITIKAEPTNPEAPNGETQVDIEFRIKDDISGYGSSNIYLRDPQGVMHHYWHCQICSESGGIYFNGDPTVYRTYHKRIILPVGSAPGTWGLAEMTVQDLAVNIIRIDFTEIVRFKVDDGTVYADADVNEDGVINVLDLVIVASFDISNERSDVNGDGIVNILDLVTVASQIGQAGTAAPAVPSPTIDQIQSWITQAMQADDGSPTFRRGIHALQNLLLTMLPETTALLPNYPNPFNPETWLPYQLATPSDVRIDIYTSDGKRIRTLDLGHQPVGIYQHRTQAAHWDGKNQTGEPVASGIYFYTLTAGTFTATRKMLIQK